MRKGKRLRAEGPSCRSFAFAQSGGRERINAEVAEGWEARRGIEERSFAALRMTKAKRRYRVGTGRSVLSPYAESGVAGGALVIEKMVGSE